MEQQAYCRVEEHTLRCGGPEVMSLWQVVPLQLRAAIGRFINIFLGTEFKSISIKYQS